MHKRWMSGVMVGVLLLSACLPVCAQQTPASDGIRTEAPVVVQGEQPGPGLWLVRSGSHELYILGTLTPLPARMQWQTAQVQRVLANAQEVIRPPGVRLDADVGIFRGLLLLPKLLAARDNPDDKTLRDVVPPATYARWQVLKARYLGNDAGVEKRRPLFAAQALYVAAIKKNGLALTDPSTAVIEAAIKQHHPKVTVVEHTIVVKDIKSLLKEWSRTTLDDQACFDNTLAWIETDLDAMRARANAWATGDVAALRTLPPPYRWEACRNAVTEAGIGKRLGFADAYAQVRKKWLDAASAALAANRVSFAVLPLTDLLGPDGYLAALQAKGYTVLAPDADDASDE